MGNCRDNAVVESLRASLKNELLFQRTFATKKEAKDAIFEWIVAGYNRRRRHSSLGYVSPEAFEAKQNWHRTEARPDLVGKISSGPPSRASNCSATG